MNLLARACGEGTGGKVEQDRHKAVAQHGEEMARAGGEGTGLKGASRQRHMGTGGEA